MVARNVISGKLWWSSIPIVVSFRLHHIARVRNSFLLDFIFHSHIHKFCGTVKQALMEHTSTGPLKLPTEVITFKYYKER